MKDHPTCQTCLHLTNDPDDPNGYLCRRLTTITAQFLVKLDFYCALHKERKSDGKQA